MVSLAILKPNNKLDRIRDLLHDKYRSSTRAKALRKKIPAKAPITPAHAELSGDLPDQRKLHGPNVDPEMGNLPDQRSLHGLRLSFQRRNTPDGKWEATFAKRTEPIRPDFHDSSLFANTYRDDSVSDSKRSVGPGEEFGRNALLRWGCHKLKHEASTSTLKERAGEDTYEQSGAPSQRETNLATALAKFNSSSGTTSPSPRPQDHSTNPSKSKLPSSTAFPTTRNQEANRDIERDIDAALDSLFPPPDPAALDAFSVAAFEDLLRGL